MHAGVSQLCPPNQPSHKRPYTAHQYKVCLSLALSTPASETRKTVFGTWIETKCDPAGRAGMEGWGWGGVYP
jgi:hypothetical protein